MTPIHIPKFRTAQTVLLALLIALATSGLGAGEPVVSVTGGQIRGVRLEDGTSAAFRGVPFAAPPVGDLRWREPMPVKPWEGVREATRTGPPAAQIPLGWNDADAKAGSEDCLYLDVWTPAPAPGGKLPVMVWIHGGANVAGAGGFDPLYDGRSLIRQGVVLVVVEYRLGILGFFSHPLLSRESPHRASGNYGLMDQAAALTWVHDNISQFGGDPGNVTLFGQSAGSMDVLSLMASPLARGLFHRAIAESGPTMSFVSQPEAEKAGIRAAESAGAPSQGTLAYLRSLPTDTVLKKMPCMMAGTTDGWVLPENPGLAFRQGHEARVPLIIGSAAIEFPAVGDPAALKTSIREFFGDLSPRAESLYGISGGGPSASDPLYGDAADQWGSDLFRCRAIVQGEWHTDSGNPTWEYEFDRAIPPKAHTGHSSDLPYVFGNLNRTGPGMTGDFEDADRGLSAAIQGYWTRFARTGDPNGAGAVPWPAYDGKARKYLIFGTSGEVRASENERGPVADLFREAMGRQ